jgi:predicted nucleic acid-binding protein
MRLAEKADPPWHICAQVLIEYWVVATRPRAVNGLGLSPEQADQEIDLILTFLNILPEPPDVFPRWRQLVAPHKVLGRPAHDARLVAVMQAHGINELITLNSDHFRRYSNLIRCRLPSEVVAAS